MLGIFRQGRHRARRGCKDHVRQISRHHREVDACERIMSRLSADRDDLYRECQRLRALIAALGPVPPPRSGVDSGTGYDRVR